MNLKPKELKSISQGLEQIIQIEMAQKTAFQLGRIDKRISSELKAYNESRVNLEKKYGSYKYMQGDEELTYKEDEKGGGSWINGAGESIEGFQINPAVIYWKANCDKDLNLYLKELEELDNQEIDLDINPVNVADLIRYEHNGQAVPLNIRPKLLGDLESIITA
jgi:hypothetical protein